jgi:hypothetical protein
LFLWVRCHNTISTELLPLLHYQSFKATTSNSYWIVAPCMQ